MKIEVKRIGSLALPYCVVATPADGRARTVYEASGRMRAIAVAEFLRDQPASVAMEAVEAIDRRTV